MMSTGKRWGCISNREPPGHARAGDGSQRSGSSTSLPGPPEEVQKVALGDNGLIHGLRPGKVYFDLSTNWPTLLRHIHEELAKATHTCSSAPVSGGPRGARSRRLAIWVGGDGRCTSGTKPCSTPSETRPVLRRSHRRGSIAKLVHNCTGYIIQTAMAETFSMGIKAGVDPLVLWQAASRGPRPTADLDSLTEHFLPGQYDPPDFALRLARKDVSLAIEVGAGVRGADAPRQMTYAELTEALNRELAQRDYRVAMLLQKTRRAVENVQLCSRKSRRFWIASVKPPDRDLVAC